MKIIFKTGAISSAQEIRKEVGMPSGPPAVHTSIKLRLEERECDNYLQNRSNLLGTRNQKRSRDAIRTPAEFREISSIASIIIESERVISVRNKSSSRVVCKTKNDTGSLITKVYLGSVNTLLNWFANKQHISYLLSVSVLFSGLSS